MTMKNVVIETLPVAVYCTTKKKCVLIFSSNNMCDKYVFDKRIYKSSRTRYLTSANGKTSNNVFDKLLAFRLANTQQKELLGAEDVVILDEEFFRYDVKMNTQMKTIKLNS